MSAPLPLSAWHEDQHKARELIRLGFPPRVLTPETFAPDHLWTEGREHHVPTCCIQQFVDDIAAGQLPAKLRGTVPNPVTGGEYVPCSQCSSAGTGAA